jgi:hypothetical protein
VRLRAWLPIVLLAAGCSSAPEPQVATPPGQSPPTPAGTPGESDASIERYVAGGGGEYASGSIPGSPDAKYYYRFRMTEPAGEGFTYQDRELSFYFRPTPFALHFQVENRTDRVLWIDWERSEFLSPLGVRGKIAHEGTQWTARFTPQTSTQLPPLQRLADYTFPMDYLVDPGASAEQMHRKLLSEGEAAIHLVNREWGVDLVFKLEEQYRTYRFRFVAVTVVPR